MFFRVRDVLPRTFTSSVSVLGEVIRFSARPACFSCELNEQAPFSFEEGYEHMGGIFCQELNQFLSEV